MLVVFHSKCFIGSWHPPRKAITLLILHIHILLLKVALCTPGTWHKLFGKKNGDLVLFHHMGFSAKENGWVYWYHFCRFAPRHWEADRILASFWAILVHLGPTSNLAKTFWNWFCDSYVLLISFIQHTSHICNPGTWKLKLSWSSQISQTT